MLSSLPRSAPGLTPSQAPAPTSASFSRCLSLRQLPQPSGTLLEAEPNQCHPTSQYIKAEARAEILSPTHSLLYIHFPLPPPSNCPGPGSPSFLWNHCTSFLLAFNSPIIQRWHHSPLKTFPQPPAHTGSGSPGLVFKAFPGELGSNLPLPLTWASSLPL